MTPDGLEAYVRYTRPEIDDLDSDKIQNVLDPEFFTQLLADNQIVFGLKEKTIQSFLANPPAGEFVLIAEGRPMIPGEDARVEYTYEMDDGGPSPKVLDDGKVDLKELNLNINVRKGDVLAKKIPATEGEAGVKVTGEEIPARKGKDLNLFAGKNTILSEDGIQLLADIDGTVSRTSNKLSVVDIYTIKGDVDYSTGNINFVGTVDILGNVLSGFKVEAHHDVIVHGIVEGAHIIAGGNVYLRRGVQGGDKGEVEAGGNIEARFVNSARLHAKESIRIGGPAMHCLLEAGDKIEFVGKNGILNGGVARATHSVEAENIGSEMGVATTVEVGVNPVIDQHYRDVCEELRVSRENLGKLNQIIKALKAMKDQQKSLPPEREKMLLDSIKSSYSMMGSVKQLEKEKETLEEEMKSSRAGHIRVRGQVFPGVTIKIGRSVSKIDHAMKMVTLKREGGEIVTV